MSEWKVKTLGAIATKDDYGLVDGPFGSNLPASSYTETGVPVIRGSNLSLNLGRFKADEFVFVSNETANRLSRSLCRPLDIIFTKKGTLGQTGIIPEKSPYDRYLLSSNQMKLTVDRSVADPLYVYYYVASPVSTEKIIRDSESTGVPKTNVTYLRTFPISLPPLPEQKAIARILSSLDDKIELNHRMNETLEEMARAIFKDWFIDFGPTRAKQEGRAPYLPDRIWSLFPGAIDDETGLPEAWELSTIGEEVKVVGGSTPSTKEPNLWDGGIAWVTPKDLSNLNSPVLLETTRTISKDGLAKISSGLLPSGTVLLSSRAPVGYLAISEMPIAINQGFIAMICERKISNIFVLLWSTENMDVILQNANGSTFQEISKRNFRPIKVIVGSSNVLDVFDENIRPLYQRIVNNEIEYRTLAETRDRLLPKLMSGEIRIKEAEKIVEEAL